MTDFTPTRVAADTSRNDAIGIINLGFIDNISDIAALIPTTAEQSWRANPEDHIRYGVKFSWRNNVTDTNRWMIRFHARDETAPEGSNAQTYWTVRIQCQRQMLETGTPPVFKAFSQSDANRSHIPIKNTVSNLRVMHALAIRMANDTMTTSSSAMQDRGISVGRGGPTYV